MITRSYQPMPRRRAPHKIYTVPAEPDSLGDRLRRLRDQANLTQEELGKLVGERFGEEHAITQAVISSWERNASRNPHPERLGMVEQVLGTSPGTLADMVGWRFYADQVRAATPPLPGSIVIPPDDERLRPFVQAYEAFLRGGEERPMSSEELESVEAFVAAQRSLKHRRKHPGRSDTT